jgi:DNA-binding response OmpR family regulator
MQAFSAILWSASFKVLEATSGDEAVEIGKGNRDTLDLLLSDVVVPQRSGTEVALELIAIHPTMAILFVTGTPLERWNNRDRNNVSRLISHSVDVLVKPFRPAALMEKIDKLLRVVACPMPLRVG